MGRLTSKHAYPLHCWLRLRPHIWYYKIVKTNESFLWDTVDIHVPYCKVCGRGSN